MNCKKHTFVLSYIRERKAFPSEVKRNKTGAVRMKCEELLKGLSYECIRGSIDCEIKQVVYDSRKLSQGCLFICICGYNVDGHSFAKEENSPRAGSETGERGSPLLRITDKDRLPEEITKQQRPSRRQILHTQL